MFQRKSSQEDSDILSRKLNFFEKLALPKTALSKDSAKTKLHAAKKLNEVLDKIVLNHKLAAWLPLRRTSRLNPLDSMIRRELVLDFGNMVFDKDHLENLL